MSITIDLRGFDDINQRLTKASDKVFAEVDAEIGASVKEMVLAAKQLAPKDQGLLAAEITLFQEAPLRWVFISQASYSAFVEFGTRSNVVIPPGLESFAGSFRGSSQSSLSAKQAIFDWCKRHGIEQRLWYAIFIKIMTRGIGPHPFFFPAFEQEKPNLLRNVKAAL